MSASEIAPFARIGLYVLAGWLEARGFPPDVARIISNDPAILEVAATGLSMLIAAIGLAWWRIAKRRGWST